MENFARADSLRVIRDQNGVEVAQTRQRLAEELAGQLRRNRPADFAVHPKHLMRMPMLSPAHEPDLDGRRTIGIAHDRRAIDARPIEFLRDEHAVRVVADDARERHFGIQTAEHVRDVRRSSQAIFLTFLAEQNDGGFLTDAFGVAPDVAVENQVPQDQNPGRSELFDDLNEMLRHASAVPGLASVTRRSATVAAGIAGAYRPLQIGGIISHDGS